MDNGNKPLEEHTMIDLDDLIMDIAANPCKVYLTRFVLVYDHLLHKGYDMAAYKLMYTSVQDSLKRR